MIKKLRSETVRFDNPILGIYVAEFRPLGKKFKFRPGQFLHLALDVYDPSYPWPESRCFSMQSSPEDEVIRITFSVKGRYTSRMVEELRPGKIVSLKLPYGDLFSGSFSKSDCVFIAGGTGITPFLSLFNSPEFSQFEKPKLYFGIKSTAYNIYTEELKKSQVINKGFSEKLCYEDVDGMLNIQSIFSENGKEATYFISGPPAMIAGFRKQLTASGVEDSHIITDDWE